MRTSTAGPSCSVSTSQRKTGTPSSRKALSALGRVTTRSLGPAAPGTRSPSAPPPMVTGVRQSLVAHGDVAVASRWLPGEQDEWRARWQRSTRELQEVAAQRLAVPRVVDGEHDAGRGRPRPTGQHLHRRWVDQVAPPPLGVGPARQNYEPT